MRYYDRSFNESIGELAAEPSDLRKMNRSGIRWAKLSVITTTDHLEVVHSVLRIGHRAIDRTRISSPKRESRPERCAKETHPANNGTRHIEHVDSQAPPLHKQLLRHIVYVLAVKLVTARDIHNRDRGEALTRPLDALNTKMNVAGQDDDISIYFWRAPVLKQNGISQTNQLFLVHIVLINFSS